ncbi:hypothetical protein EYF88_08280 [Paracoccus sediminis]|uniref:Uncharacterized protein n=1 Tax=Paracoccus sediminis TaxID=1214787 RepID=A0A238WES4_9RHOB|nr:hypothetical protein [Paracoccus sediminis]TBN50898.1 hypothetical protein EYF88_08280 [Paracoccus sediminis]SNR44948.1 hypothetical protein SAMN06265378_104125 [Paracoccus sediminis]
MIALASLRTVAGRGNLLVFDDADDAYVHHVLPLKLVPDSPPTLTVMGRGPRDRAEGILGGFWTLPLRGDAPSQDLAAITARLTRPDSPPPRLAMAEADLDLRVLLIPEPETGSANLVAAWRGGTIVLNGEAPAGAAGAALARAWDRGLPDGAAHLTLTLHGMTDPDGATILDETLRLSGQDGQVKLEVSTASTTTRQRAMGVLTIRREQPLRLPADRDVIWAGFDRA